MTEVLDPNNLPEPLSVILPSGLIETTTYFAMGGIISKCVRITKLIEKVYMTGEKYYTALEVSTGYEIVGKYDV